ELQPPEHIAELRRLGRLRAIDNALELGIVLQLGDSLGVGKVEHRSRAAFAKPAYDPDTVVDGIDKGFAAPLDGFDTEVMRARLLQCDLARVIVGHPAVCGDHVFSRWRRTFRL